MANEIASAPNQYPLLPLRDVVVFPHMVIPLFVGRPKSIKAMEIAMEAGKSILLVAQKSAAKDEPTAEDLYKIGCISNILQMLKLPDGTVKVLVEGSQRARIQSIDDMRSHYVSEATAVPGDAGDVTEIEAMRRALIAQFDQYVKLNKKIPPEILTSLAGIEEAGRLADTIAAHLPLKLEQKQQVLEMFEVKARLEHLLSQLETEIDILQVEKRIRGRVKRQMEKSQREYYLNEQVKAIQKELGEGEDGADLEEMEKHVKAARMPKEARKKAEAELKKLRLMSPMSAEATVVRNYIETLVNLPWKKRSKISRDIGAAEKILDADHCGLEKVKERIVEYLAVQSRVDKVKAPILCLVGAPGVGKTSLGQSIARATNRKFVRMSLGGVRDEAEIRGHRRTYIGSMPGKILQNMSKVGVKNPLFLRDEVDRMGMGWRAGAGARALQDLSQGGEAAAHREAGGRREGAPHHGDAEEPRQVPRRAQVQLRHGGKAEPGGTGHRPSLDRGRRRAADHRGGDHAGQGQDDHHRQAGRSDAGVDPRRAVGGAGALAQARREGRLLPEERHPHPPAGGRNPEGRAERRHRYRHLDGVDPVGHPGARRRRHDRGDHAARRGAADWRAQGKAARGAPRRDQDGADPRGERERPGRDPGQHQEQARDRAGEMDRQSARDRARAPARAAVRGRRFGADSAQA